MWLVLIGGYVVFSLITLALCHAAAVGDRTNRKQRNSRPDPRLANVIPISDYRRPA
jgi:hypothetical protein